MFSELTQLILGAGFNLIVALLIVRFIYYPSSPNKNYVFTFVAFNTVVYFVLGLFTSVNLSVGVGFGLFAIFSVLRYRTDEMPIREMTYLFVLIALPIMNSFFLANGDWAQLLAANGMMIALLYGLEKGWGFHFESSQKIHYDRLDLITPAKREQLWADLCGRTGLFITRIEIGRLDFLRETAEIKIHYDMTQSPTTFNHPVTPANEFAFTDDPVAETA